MHNFDLKKKTHIFIDFDGTLKDSDNIKGKLFSKLFRNNIKSIRNKILEHHRNNLGVSRTKKIPLYMKWSREPLTKPNKKKFFTKYKNEVFKKICKSKWMPGASLFIKKNRNKKIILLTATPHLEIIRICKKLNIYFCFDKILGHPNKKEEAISRIVKKRKLKKNECLYIGNANSDYKAANINKIKYIHFNKKKIKLKKNVDVISNFSELKF